MKPHSYQSDIPGAWENIMMGCLSGSEVRHFLLGQGGLRRCYLSCLSFLLLLVPKLIQLLVTVEPSEVQARDAVKTIVLVIQEGDPTQETPVCEILRAPQLRVAIAVPCGVTLAFETRQLL